MYGGYTNATDMSSESTPTSSASETPSTPENIEPFKSVVSGSYTVYYTTGIAGFLKEGARFDPSKFEEVESTGNTETLLWTDYTDGDGDTELVVFRPPAHVPTLNCPTIFVSEERISDALVDTGRGPKSETTYKSPVKGVDKVVVTSCADQPYAHRELVDSLISPELASLVDGWYPVKVESCIAERPVTAQLQSSALSQVQ
jgi:hypothetical protein